MISDLSHSLLNQAMSITGAYVHPRAGGMHGTTAMAFHYNGGVLLISDSRSSNEKQPNGAKLKIRNLIKFYQIKQNVVGIMLGDKNDSEDMRDELQKNCKQMGSVQDVFNEAERYVSSFSGQDPPKKFGTILCGCELKGNPRIFSIYVNGKEVEKTTDTKFVVLGSGSKHAKRKAAELMGTVDETKFNFRLTKKACMEFCARCAFESAFFDLATGGPLNFYNVWDQQWEMLWRFDVLDAYSTFYDFYEEEKTLFLILNCSKADHLFSKHIIDHFRPKGEIEFAHRVAEIRLSEQLGFFFHRLVCKTTKDASNILNYVMSGEDYKLLRIPQPGSSAEKIANAFPRRVSVKVTFEDENEIKEEIVNLYVNKASRKLLNLLQSCHTPPASP